MRNAEKDKAEEEQTSVSESSQTTTSTEQTGVTTSSSEPMGDPYDDWTEVESDSCMISFYVPDEWYDNTENNIEFCKTFTTTEEIIPTDVGGYPGLILYSLSWMAEDHIDYDTPQEYYEYLLTTPIGKSELTIETKLIDGQEGYYVINSSKMSGTHYTLYYKASDGKYYALRWGSRDVDSYKDILDKIIESADIK